jgi:hypothetical protein
MAYVREKGARKRAYLKAAPKRGKSDDREHNQEVRLFGQDHVRGIGKPLPARKRWSTTDTVMDGTTGDYKVWWGKPTPFETDPVIERNKAIERELENARKIFKQIIAKTSLIVVWICFDGLDHRRVFWIEWLDIATKELRTSFTDSDKDRLMSALRKNEVPWKSKEPYHREGK